MYLIGYIVGLAIGVGGLAAIIYFIMWLFSSKRKDPMTDTVALAAQRKKTAIIIAAIIFGIMMILARMNAYIE